MFSEATAFPGGRLRFTRASLLLPAALLGVTACGSKGPSGRDAGGDPDVSADVIADLASDARARDMADSAVDARQAAAPEVTPVLDTSDVSDAALVSDLPLAPTDGPAVGAPDLPSLTDVAEAPSCRGICNAATPSYPSVGPDSGLGNITMYSTEASSGGACGYGATRVMYFVASNVNVAPGDGKGHWQAGRICGQCVEVTAFTSQGPRSVVVRIMDRCADEYCGMDLGGLAPAAIMLDGFGRYDGAWRFVSCTGHPDVSDGPASLVVLPNANPYWSRVHIRNGPGATDEIAWSDSQGGAGSFPYASNPENTFEVPAQVLQSAAASLAITARFFDGSTATVSVSPAELATGNTSYPLQ